MISDSVHEHSKRQYLASLITDFPELLFCIVLNSSRSFDDQQEVLEEEFPNRVITIQLNRKKKFLQAVRLGVRAMNHWQKFKFLGYVDLELEDTRIWIGKTLSRIIEEDQLALDLLNSNHGKRYFDKISFQLADLTK